jgi:putative transposase
MTQDLRLGYWADLLRQRRESGKTIRSFCRENGINEKTWYYWQRRLREAAGERMLAQSGDSAPDVPMFAELPMLPEPASASGSTNAAIRIQLGRAVVEFQNGADKNLAASILRALLKQC